MLVVTVTLASVLRVQATESWAVDASHSVRTNATQSVASMSAEEILLERARLLERAEELEMALRTNHSSLLHIEQTSKGWGSWDSKCGTNLDSCGSEDKCVFQCMDSIGCRWHPDFQAEFELKRHQLDEIQGTGKYTFGADQPCGKDNSGLFSTDTYCKQDYRCVKGRCQRKGGATTKPCGTVAECNAACMKNEECRSAQQISVQLSNPDKPNPLFTVLGLHCSRYGDKGTQCFYTGGRPCKGACKDGWPCEKKKGGNGKEYKQCAQYHVMTPDTFLVGEVE